MRYIFPIVFLLLAGCGGASGSDRTAVFLHGGGWYSGTPDQMDPLVTQFAAAGWRTHNMEYPLYPEASVREQMVWTGDRIETLCRDTTCVLIGFSAGAQLAIHASEHADFVVALSPALGLCSPVAGFTPVEMIEAIGPRCNELEPMPSDTPTLLWHGENDELIPLVRAQHFANHRGGNVTLRIEEEQGHGFWRDEAKRVGRELVQLADKVVSK